MADVIRLGQENCQDCYKCIRDCLLKAIRYSNGHAEIIQEECIQCGECVVTCPRHVEMEDGSLDRVRRKVRAGRRVVASVSGAFIAALDVGSIEDLRDAMVQLGFEDAQETAIGAEIVSREYERIMASGETDVLISSNCPPINQLIQKYYPSMLPYLAPVQTPTEVHCRRLKRQYPDAFVVFIGSCYAEKIEAMERGFCDAVLMFSDLKRWLHEAGVTPVNHGIQSPRGGMRARRYPRHDGIVKSMTRQPGWSRVSIDGVSNCISALEEVRQSSMKHVFLEMTACDGSCVNGPAIRSSSYENRVRGTVMVDAYAGDHDFGVHADQSVEKRFDPEPVTRVAPNEEEVEKVLARLRKDTADTALNCGCCGYPTCREMASALCQGKAQMDMCLPYLREKAERHSREVVNNTLEAADKVIDRQMRVVQNIASILGETTAETKVMLVKLKDAIQDSEREYE